MFENAKQSQIENPVHPQGNIAVRKSGIVDCQSVSQDFTASPLTNNCSLSHQKTKQKKSNIDRQNHHQENVVKLSPCLGST